MTVIDIARGQLVQPRATSEHRAQGRIIRRGSWETTYRTVLIALDIVAAVGLVALVSAWSSMTLELLTFPVVWIAIASVCGAYRPNLIGAGAHDVRPVLWTAVIVLAALPVGEMLGVVQAPGERAVVQTTIALAVLACASRGVARQTLNARRRGELGTCAYRVLIAGGS